jgi:hypothetical protein
VSNAQERGWGPPRPPGHPDLVTIEAAGIRLRVHRRVALIFTRFIEAMAAKGYPVDQVADDWGHAYRPIRGYTMAQALADPDKMSNHAWGLAVDLNATRNPMSERLISDMPSWMPDLAARYRLRWGGNYQDRKDPMHFEWVGTPQDADALTRRLEAADQGGLHLDADVKARFDNIDRDLAVVRRKIETTFNQVNIKAGQVYNAVQTAISTVGASKEAVLGALTALPPPDVDEDAVAAKVKELLDTQGVAIDPQSILQALRANPLAPIADPTS